MDWAVNLTLFLLYLFVFVFGCCIGSFLNVLVYRVPNHISFVKGRSFCPNCHAPIKNRDLIPILSFLFLRGKCRGCGQRISPRYPLVEAFAGLLAALCFWRFDFTIQALVAFAFCAILLTVALIDHDTMTIPNGLIIALMVPALCCVFLFPSVGLLARVIGFFAVSLPMLLLNLLIPDCFGGGDIKLMAVCGFALGWQNTLVAAFLAVLLCGVVSVYLLAIKRVGKGCHIAFGPYLTVGLATAFLYGEPLLRAYLSIFGL